MNEKLDLLNHQNQTIISISNTAPLPSTELENESKESSTSVIINEQRNTTEKNENFSNQENLVYSIQQSNNLFPNSASEGNYPPPLKGGADETNIDSAILFSEQSIRNAFIRKVFTILAIQLTITFGIMTAFVFNEDAQTWLKDNFWIGIVASVAYIGVAFKMCCCNQCFRQFPTNYILLTVLTLSLTVIMSFSAISVKQKEPFVHALLMTIFVVIALGLFAVQTKIDFTQLYGIMVAVIIVFIIASLIYIFFPKSRTVSLVFAMIGVILFSIFLIMDIQAIMGGNHSFQFSPEDYIAAVIAVYLDIILIFLYLLKIFGGSN